MNARKIYPILGARICDGVLPLAIETTDNGIAAVETCTAYGKIQYNDSLLCQYCFNELQARLAGRIHARLDA